MRALATGSQKVAIPISSNLKRFQASRARDQHSRRYHFLMLQRTGAIHDKGHFFSGCRQHQFSSVFNNGNRPTQPGVVKGTFVPNVLKVFSAIRFILDS